MFLRNTFTAENNPQEIQIYMNNSEIFVPKLSDRETQLLYLIANEYSSLEIAKLLFLSKNTVDSHKKNLFLKLNVSNSAGLIRRAYELRLLPMERPDSLPE